MEPSDNELVCKSGAIGVLPETDDTTVCLPAPAIKDKAGPEYKCGSVQDTCLYESEVTGVDGETK